MSKIRVKRGGMGASLHSPAGHGTANFGYSMVRHTSGALWQVVTLYIVWDGKERHV